jgi:hypothetical protein
VAVGVLRFFPIGNLALARSEIKTQEKDAKAALGEQWWRFNQRLPIYRMLQMLGQIFGHVNYNS